MTRSEMQFAHLVATIERLAAPSEQQRTYLLELGTDGLVDELALEFDDALQPVSAYFEQLGIDALTAADIGALSEQLRSMSGPSHVALWRSSALDGPEWSRTRALAAEVLESLGPSESRKSSP